ADDIDATSSSEFFKLAAANTSSCWACAAPATIDSTITQSVQARIDAPSVMRFRTYLHGWRLRIRIAVLGERFQAARRPPCLAYSPLGGARPPRAPQFFPLDHPHSGTDCIAVKGST